MADQKDRAKLDKENPNMTFEELLKKKMLRKNISREQAAKEI